VATLIEAIGTALHSLNAGGVPVVLVREKNARLPAVEIRLRWEHGPATADVERNPSKDPNARGRLITERRWFGGGEFTPWVAACTEMFSIADVYNDCFHEAQEWTVRFPQHSGQTGYPCPACAQDEDRQPVTVKHTQNSCAYAAGQFGMRVKRG
jgi:hypothetical protein